MRFKKRRGVAVIIATLIMVAAAALFTSIMLYWGSAYLGQSTTNFGSALFRSNNAAAEQVSIDNVLFSPNTTPNSISYSATVFARNFGDNPVKIAGVHVANLQSGSSPPGFDCEVNVNSAHLTIVARAVGSINLATQCKTPINPSNNNAFPVCWDGATIAIMVSTEGGTSYHKNYVVPSVGIAIPSVTYVESGTAPSVTVTVNNVGCGSVTLSTMTVTGISTNAGFRGSLAANIPTGSGSITVTASDGSSWISPQSGPLTIAQGGSQSVTLCPGTSVCATGAGASTGIARGDFITITVTTSAAASSSGEFTPP